MERTDFGRIEAFSDGVMAVAITLLVLAIEVPDVDPEQLGDALRELDSSLLAYILTFALIGRFWVIHHNLFASLQSFDGLLMALNLAFLMMIALMPFGMDLVDSYPDEGIATAVFAAMLALASLLHWGMTAHSARSGFVKQRRPGDTRFGSAIALGFVALYALSIPVAFASALVAQLMWASTLLLRYPLRTLAERVAR